VDWIASERFTGTYMRQFSVGDGVDADHISAANGDGALAW
jgi:HSP20 family protein